MAALSVAGNAHAQVETPDYLDVAAYLETVAELVTTSGACRDIGFTVQRPNHDQLMATSMAYAVRQGVDRELAMQLLADATRREADNLRALTSDGAFTGNTNEELFEEYLETIDFMQRRCEGLADSDVGRRWITKGPGQAGVVAGMRARMRRQLELPPEPSAPAQQP